jgi:polar amino acid transport system substrate-binding protein
MSFIWLILACPILLISLPQQSWSQIEVTVYGDNSYPPYSYEEDGRAEGIYTRILHKAFSKMDGYQVKIKAVPWKRGLVYLERGGGFALFPPYHHQTERTWMWPYSVSILEEKVVVFCRRDRMESPRPVWPRDYYGLSVAMNSGFMVGGNAFVDALKQGHIKLEESSSNATNIIKLVRRRVDCYINDRLSILSGIEETERIGHHQ